MRTKAGMKAVLRRNDGPVRKVGDRSPERSRRLQPTGAPPKDAITQESETDVASRRR